MGMQVNIEITIDEVENQMNIDLSGEEMGILIGKRNYLRFSSVFG